jgi:hypothetical protein
MRCTRILIGGTAKRLVEKDVSSFDASRLPRLPSEAHPPPASWMG